MRCIALVVVAGSTVATADVATWSWTVSDSGNRDGVIEPGETALLTLSIAFDPPQPQLGGALGQAGPYDIMGDRVWAQGLVNTFDNLIDDGVPEGTLDGDNTVRDVEHFQLPMLFDDQFFPDNPVDVYFISWTPSSYTPATVNLGGRASGAWIYIDYEGNAMWYDGAGGDVSFRIVPAPAAAAVLAITGLCMLPRRRVLG